jgi:protein-S-isoprenylcysteine O-methyltransferase Ste14
MCFTARMMLHLSAMPSLATHGPRSLRHHWSDWVGLAAFTTLAFLLWRRSVEFGIALLPVFCYELLAAISFIVRRPLQRQATGAAPRLVAYAHSFMPMAFLEAASRWRPEWLRATSAITLNYLGIGVWLVASVLALWPIWYLRRAFSIEPQARVLVTGGPYRLARHPIYVLYLLINASLLVRHPTPQLAGIIAVWVVLLLLRVRYEEHVLEATFPEYASYRASVGAFGPRLRAPARPREV